MASDRAADAKVRVRLVPGRVGLEDPRVVTSRTRNFGCVALLARLRRVVLELVLEQFLELLL